MDEDQAIQVYCGGFNRRKLLIQGIFLLVLLSSLIYAGLSSPGTGKGGVQCQKSKR